MTPLIFSHILRPGHLEARRALQGVGTRPGFFGAGTEVVFPALRQLLSSAPDAQGQVHLLQGTLVTRSFPRASTSFCMMRSSWAAVSFMALAAVAL
eukprot:g16707.t1